MSEVNMKIFVIILIGLLFISCKDSNVNPIPDPEPSPCEVPLFGMFDHFSKGKVPISISSDNKILAYRSTLDTFKKIYFQNLTSNQIHSISDAKFNQYLAEFQKAFPSPYNNDEFIVVHKFRNDSIPSGDTKKVFFTSRRLYLFNFSSQTLIEITPVKYIKFGLPAQFNPIVWLKNSSQNNDFVDCGNGGVIHLQSGEVTISDKKYSSVLTKSNDGTIVVKINSNDSMVSLNEVPLVSWTSSSGFSLDKDNKFLSFLNYSTIDTINTFQNFWTIYIVDVSKTLNTNKVEYINVIDLKNVLCSFQTGSLITINSPNSIILPLSRYSIQDKSNLYEIDFNGKILRQLTND